MLLGCHVNRGQQTSEHAAEQTSEHAAESIVSHIQKARDAAFSCGVDLKAAQIFVGGPYARKIIMDAAESALLRRYIDDQKFTVYAHSAYVAPLFGGDPDAARYVREELATCAAAGIRGLVVHLPKAPINKVLKYITRTLCPASSRVCLFLETPAVTPPETYYETPEKLNELFDALLTLDPDRTLFGLCVDTAHIWTSGVDISSRGDAEEWLSRLALAGVPLMFHLNDSERACGTGPDSHAALLSGRIWQEYESHPRASGLAAFLEYAEQHRTVVILERKPKEALDADYRHLVQMVPSLNLTKNDTDGDHKP